MLLSEIFDKVKMENAASKLKYGLWSSIPEPEQKEAIEGEMYEWQVAYFSSDVHGEHGEVAELIDLINTACRRIQFLTGEPDA